MTFLPEVSPTEARSLSPDPVDESVKETVEGIINDVKDGGESALELWNRRLGDGEAGNLVKSRESLEAAWRRLAPATQDLLSRTAQRIKRFAEAQRACLTDLELPIEGGVVGHEVRPIARAGCYAPAGRFPLPSSVLMTVVTARAAGVSDVTAVFPRGDDVMLGAAFLAGADRVLLSGGAQAVAALAYGVAVPKVDVIVGPGSVWVTAAKQAVSDRVGIDMLAGPSELLVVADDEADPEWVAADLLAQAEHDTAAMPILVTPSRALLAAVHDALARQLENLVSPEVARISLSRGFSVVVSDLDEAVRVCDDLAPEHLQWMTQGAQGWAAKCQNFGAVFLGPVSAEVLGDYGAGPNHTLPTGGTSRRRGGLSVFDFLRIRTWIKIDDDGGARGLLEDAQELAQVEGLQAHSFAATVRLEK